MSTPAEIRLILYNRTFTNGTFRPKTFTPEKEQALFPGTPSCASVLTYQKVHSAPMLAFEPNCTICESSKRIVDLNRCFALLFNQMVEYNTANLDLIFHSLADPTRRDILDRVSQQSLSIGQIASDYDLTFAAVSKHLKVMERAKLVEKQRRGKEQVVSAAPSTVKDASEYLRRYEAMWNERFDALDKYLKNNP